MASSVLKRWVQDKAVTFSPPVPREMDEDTMGERELLQACAVIIAHVRLSACARACVHVCVCVRACMCVCASEIAKNDGLCPDNCLIELDDTARKPQLNSQF